MTFSVKKFLSAAIVAATLTGGAWIAQAHYTDPVWEMRRTLNMSFGQHRVRLEAPMGMCFLDESQYMESTVIKHLRGMEQDSGDGLLMAMFASCDEIEKFSQLPALAADTPRGVDPPTANLENRGTISWLAPKLGPAPLSLAEYLDLREPEFRDDVRASVSKGYKKFGSSQSIKMSDNVFANLAMGAPDQYRFDDRARRTAAGVSIGYTTEFVQEYQKHKLFGAVGTTLVRGLPVLVSLTEDGTGFSRDQEELHATLDKLLAQVAKLNP